MTASDELAALDREFNTSETMRVETYNAQREKILERAATAPVAATSTPVPAATLESQKDLMPVTRGFLIRVMTSVVKMIAKTMRADDAKLRDDLDARIKALEDRLPLAYGGTWADGQQSNKGVFYTFSGSLWYARETTRDRPGTSDAFQLACKRGADGKDMR